jgi:GNAT superfamily N-acetyltransferase
MGCMTTHPIPTPVQAQAPAAPATSTASMIRPAEPRDVPAIVGLITALADYEQLTHLLEVTAEKLEPHLFGERPAAQCLVAEVPADLSSAGDAMPATTIAGFALYFSNYSTFLAKPGIYLEDLFVLPAYRGQGIGRALFRQVAQIAVAREAGRLEWSVLDWNEPALKFYRSQGAQPLTEWTVQRLTGEALARVATKHS